MALLRRTKFSDGYLLEKVRAITLTAREPRPACHRVVNLIHETYPHYTWTGLWVRRPRSLSLVFHRGASATPAETSEPLDGLLGWAVRSRRTQIVPDALIDPRYARIEIPIKSEIIVPMKLQNRAVGLLDICSDQAAAFDRLDLQLLEAVGQALAPLLAALTAEAPVPAAAAPAPALLQRRGYG